MWLPDDKDPRRARFTRTPHGWAIACNDRPTLTAADATTPAAFVDGLRAFFAEQGIQVQVTREARDGA